MRSGGNGSSTSKESTSRWFRSRILSVRHALPSCALHKTAPLSMEPLCFALVSTTASRNALFFASRTCLDFRITNHENSSYCFQDSNSAIGFHPITLLTITADQYTTATRAPATRPMDCSGFFSISKCLLNHSKPMSNRRAALRRKPEPA